jgi:class 3 adenylate cyclase
MPQKAAVLFIDAVGSVDISRIYGPINYNCNFLRPLQSCFRDTLFLHNLATKEGNRIKLKPHNQPSYNPTDSAKIFWSIRGDELCAVIACVNDDDVPKALRKLLWLGLETKLIWWQREPNLTRLHEGATVFELGLGLHLGPVMVEPRPWQQDDCSNKDTVEGLALNYAKRIEGISRSGENSGLMVSEEAWRALGGNECLDIFFAQPRRELLKGMDPLKVHEVVAYKPPEVILTTKRVDDLEKILITRPFDLSANYVLMHLFATNGKHQKIKRLQTNIDLFAKEHDGLKEWMDNA